MFSWCLSPLTHRERIPVCFLPHQPLLNSGLLYKERFIWVQVFSLYSRHIFRIKQHIFDRVASHAFVSLNYSEPSFQRQHLFPKTMPIKWICCCTEYLMSKSICKRRLVLFLFPHRTCFGYLLELPHWSSYNKYPKYMFLKNIKYNIHA